MKAEFTNGPSASHPTGKKPTGAELALAAGTAGAVAGVTGEWTVQNFGRGSPII